MSPRAAALLPLALTAAAFLTLSDWLVARWRGADGYFSHGPLVPLAAAWLVWARRAAIGRALAGGTGDWRALGAAVPAALLVAAGAFLRIDSVTAGALLLLAASAVWLAAGAAALRALLVPLAFLAFMVPWPLELVADTVQSLKLLVVSVAGGLLAALGSGVSTSGSWLVLASGERLLVDDECSGLSSAIALLTLGAFMAVSTQRLPQARRLVLLLAALPIALAANLARVLGLALVGMASGAGAVVRWHDATNLLVYVVAIAAFVGLERRLAPLPAGGAAASAEPEPPAAAVAPRRGPAGAAAVLAALALVATLALRAPVASVAALRIAAIPAALRDWQGSDVALTERQYALLETRDVLLRRYASGQASVLACLAVAGVDRRAAHPPATCYRGQGFAIEAEEHVVATFAGQEREFTELVIAKDGERTLVWSWYRAGADETASWWALQRLALAARVARRDVPVALLRFSTALPAQAAAAGADRVAARRDLAAFLARFLPVVDAALAPALPCFVIPARE